MGNAASQPEELDRLIELLDEIIDVRSRDTLFTDAATKISYLERALEVWRFHANQPDNALPLERFIQCSTFVDNGRITFKPPEKERDLGSGTRPIRLQPPLLIFLLLYHRDQFAIYDIIQKFVDKIRGDLTILDFKRTRTGVTRCFTNTRFAALTLRNHGLLKFTHKEAFKTWVLSLPGILVASRTIKQGQPWRVPETDGRKATLHEAILSSHLALHSYDQFVGELNAVCRPNVEVFKTFERVLGEAYKRLPGYWQALRDPNLNQKERTKETTARLAELDALPQMDEFYAEFSRCVNVERLLRDIDSPAEDA